MRLSSWTMLDYETGVGAIRGAEVFLLGLSEIAAEF